MRREGFDALDPRTRTLSAHGVSRFLSSLLGDKVPADTNAAQSPELVWTLPHSHPFRAMQGQTYLDCCLRLINEAKECLTLVSPFILKTAVDLVPERRNGYHCST